MTGTLPAFGLPLCAQSVEVTMAERGRAARRVLDVVRFELAAGAQIAICGPSGSGKTTLLHAFAGIEPVTRGSVRWGAVDVAALTPTIADRWRRETVGIV